VWLVGPRVDLHETVLGSVPWETGQRVLDVGCGPGAYIQRLAAREPGLRLTGVDLSPGMLREARAAVPSASLAVADVMRLPFPSRAFERVLAPHMLYHAPDPDAAVAELQRVLAPDGAAVVVTNAGDHLRGFRELMAASAGMVDWVRSFQNFQLDNGAEILQRHFASVERRDIENELAVPEVDPVVAYVASMRSSLEPQLPDGLAWDAALARVRAQVEATIRERGAFTSPTHTGVLVCR
jgi:SAM-dependent methyltransferase